MDRKNCPPSVSRSAFANDEPPFGSCNVASLDVPSAAAITADATGVGVSTSTMVSEVDADGSFFGANRNHQMP
ncbi:hypothetical protein A2348_05335 [Candidatus Uhrbacteria bacterium RIFOXYB12_FULL_58_10]|uniref:Uncharacterized protein n=1 Tax=Candidatus Uhrbacteria bacterium RIFOXYB2_FULL_57_15 TaxID=1802422 RepID=A0A1F7W5P1_9BACT|nr:MAG: hypothetical protein A2348_05335 [Candidatus Uhrbacteria bacterium RIFOXYB12_FULL_58_10]OGL97698.1 MAG: hypothetical protein A2304_00335 [Candidatus Uhrbacteria bacterium RIFOXYB2_FULL_57_15]OGM00047.1 MAG: hypothetical protein A2501_03800 [Candidatus Uhrbacteria bacterium RIFOXYC12_FULL_57_11]